MQKCDIKWVQISFIHSKAFKKFSNKRNEKKIGNGNDPNPSNEGCITVKQPLLTTSIG
jgi:hypothetical protein